jgi:tripartite-type tricarboxylate transporter receptor subunit TctC
LQKLIVVVSNAVAILSLLIVVSQQTSAEATFPSRPITVVVPYAAGGGVDLMMRRVARTVEQLSKATIVIENRAGAGGTIGTQQVARATADGYSLGEIDASTNAANYYLVKKLSYDPLKDFQPITLFYYSPAFLFVRSGLPISSIRDIASIARSKKAGLTYATQGLGSNGHLMGALLQKALDAPLVAVPYNNTSLLRQDLAAGRVDMIFSNYGSMLGEMAAGTAKPVAVAAPNRLAVRPDLPTMIEEGFPHIESFSWWGLAGPAGIDPAVVHRLNELFTAAVRTSEISDLMNSRGMAPAPGSPEDFHKVIEATIGKAGVVMKELGIAAR